MSRPVLKPGPGGARAHGPPSIGILDGVPAILITPHRRTSEAGHLSVRNQRPILISNIATDTRNGPTSTTLLSAFRRHSPLQGSHLCQLKCPALFIVIAEVGTATAMLGIN